MHLILTIRGYTIRSIYSPGDPARLVGHPDDWHPGTSDDCDCEIMQRPPDAGPDNPEPDELEMRAEARLVFSNLTGNAKWETS